MPSNEELAAYEPQPEVLKKMGEVILYALVAPDSSGKDTVMNWLIKNYPDRFAPIVGDTSRPPRDDEANGVTYHFRTRADMEADLKAGRFVQVVPGFEGNFYATRPEQYPAGKFALKPIQAREVSNYESMKLKQVEWLQIVPPDYETWMDWRSKRIYSQRDRAERDQEAIQSYTLALANPSSRFILNDTVEKAALRILQVADTKVPDDEAKAKQAARDILRELKARAHN